MNAVKLGQIGIKAVTGLEKRILKKQLTALTPSELCKVVKASVTSSDPLTDFIIEGCFKNGKQFENMANAASKFVARAAKTPDKIWQGGGKIVEKGKFTPKGKFMLAELLRKAGLPQTATVEDAIKNGK